MNFKLCINCNNKFYQTPDKRGHIWRNAKFCNLKCWHIYKVKNGINYGFKKGVSLFQEHKHSQESIDKMKQSHKGQIAWNKGMKGLLLNRNFIDNNPTIRGEGSRLHWNWPRGKKNHKWKGGISNRDIHSLNNPLYRHWRRQVFERDGFKCRMANKDCDIYVQAHHILRWADFPELRYEVNNGITLCKIHHPRKKADEQKLAPIFQELVKG